MKTSKLLYSFIVFSLTFIAGVSGVIAQTTIFSDNFEGAFPGTWYVGNNNSNTVAKWGDNSAKAFSGSWSAFCADNGNNLRTTYDNNLSTYMQRKNISLSGYASATLTFIYWMNTEDNYDVFEVNVRNQSGTWKNHMAISGNISGWQERTINLNEYAGQTDLIISFDFTSDGGIVPSGHAGVWIDDIVLTASENQPSLQLSVAPADVQTKDWGESVTYTITVYDNNYIRLSGANVLITDAVMAQSALAGPTNNNGETTYITTVPSGRLNDTYSMLFTGTKSGYVDSPQFTRYVKVNHITDADLAVSNLSFLPQTINPNEHPTAVSFNLTNNGPADLAPPNTEVIANFYISSNTTFGDGDDIKIGNNTYDETLSSGSSETITLSSGGLSYITIPSNVSGNYYVFVQIEHYTPSTLTDPDSSNNYTINSGIIITSVDPYENSIPSSYAIGQNYPNPFNPVTIINYSIPQQSFVNISIYNILGKKILTLINEEKHPDNYKVIFNGTNLTSGTYFYRMVSDNFSETKKLILLK